MNAEESTKTRTFLLYFGYATLALVILVLPLVFRGLDLSIVRNTKGPTSERYELFGFFCFLAMAAFAAYEIRKRRPSRRSTLIPIVVGVLVCLSYLTLITGYPLKSRDYEHYEEAGKDLMHDRNPYRSRTYLYPPLFANAFVTAYRAVDTFFLALWGKQLRPNVIWDVVFYLYQCSQFYLVVIAYLLCYRFARANQVHRRKATLLVAAIFLFNTPMFRTLRHNQVNLWVLDFALAGILLLPRFPIVTGAAVALAAHLKVYPLILGLPWLIARQWRAIVWTSVFLVGIVMWQTRFFQDWTLWIQCSELFQGFPGKVHFRDNSVHSITFNLVHLPAEIFGIETDLSPVSEWLYRIAVVVASLLFVRRFLAREKDFSDLPEEMKEKRNTDRLFAHSMDGLALALLIAPSVWEHVYILAMPIFLYAAAACLKQDFWKVCLAGFFIFSVPIFDVFPLSYHRVAALLFLLHYYSPARVGQITNPVVR